MKNILFLIVLTMAFTGCSFINSKFGLSDDNIAEEVAEGVIEKQIGTDIDLTPSTPEKS